MNCLSEWLHAVQHIQRCDTRTFIFKCLVLQRRQLIRLCSVSRAWMSAKHRWKNTGGGNPKFEKNVSTSNPTCTGLGSKSCCCGERPATNGLRHATAKHCIASSNLARGARMCVYFQTPHTRRVLGSETLWQRYSMSGCSRSPTDFWTGLGSQKMEGLGHCATQEDEKEEKRTRWKCKGGTDKPLFFCPWYTLREDECVYVLLYVLFFTVSVEFYELVYCL